MINPAANNWRLPLQGEAWVGQTKASLMEAWDLDLAIVQEETPIYDSMRLWLFKRYNRMTCVELRELHRTLRIELYHSHNKRKLISNLIKHFYNLMDGA